MRTHLLLAVTLAVALAATPASAAPSGPAHAVRPAASAASAAWKPVVPFIEDDFGRALALAKERKLPVFIEGWAPW